MEVDGAMLATELRRRRVRHQGMLATLRSVRRSTWVPGDLRATPTPLLVLAAMSLTGSQHDGGGGTAGPRAGLRAGAPLRTRDPRRRSAD